MPCFVLGVQCCQDKEPLAPADIGVVGSSTSKPYLSLCSRCSHHNFGGSLCPCSCYDIHDEYHHASVDGEGPSSSGWHDDNPQVHRIVRVIVDSPAEERQRQLSSLMASSDGPKCQFRGSLRVARVLNQSVASQDRNRFLQPEETPPSPRDDSEAEDRAEPGHEVAVATVKQGSAPTTPQDTT